MIRPQLAPSFGSPLRWAKLRSAGKRPPQVPREVTNIDGRINGDHLGVTWGGLPSDNLLKLSFLDYEVLFLVDFQKESQQSDELPQSV